MNLLPIHHQIETNDISLHYIEYPSDHPTLICLHGITANCRAFDGLVLKGLDDHFRIISADLRGRGLTSMPAFGYSMQEHARDILGLLDHLKIEKAVFMGHSFGGLLSCYIAASYPERVDKLIIVDAAARMSSNVAEMLAPTFSRLDRKFETWDEYLDMIKSAPFMKPWSDDMLSYYQADVMETAEGGVTPRPNLANIAQCVKGVSAESWPIIMRKINHPTILLRAVDIYTLGEPLLSAVRARETADFMQNATYIPIDGNHHTMMYGKGAMQIVEKTTTFLMSS